MDPDGKLVGAPNENDWNAKQPLELIVSANELGKPQALDSITVLLAVVNTGNRFKTFYTEFLTASHLCFSALFRTITRSFYFMVPLFSS